MEFEYPRLWSHETSVSIFLRFLVSSGRSIRLARDNGVTG